MLKNLGLRPSSLSAYPVSLLTQDFAHTPVFLHSKNNGPRVQQVLGELTSACVHGKQHISRISEYARALLLPFALNFGCVLSGMLQLQPRQC